MNNEELVALIQGGEREKLPELWCQVERFVVQQAHRRLVLSDSMGGVEFGEWSCHSHSITGRPIMQ